MKKILLSFTISLLISIFAYSQDNFLKKNKWSSWETDTSITYGNKINITKKRVKYTSKDCLITEEIIYCHDECNNIIRKTKIRSDCKRNIGEGKIIYERKYKSKCNKKKSINKSYRQ